MSDRAYELFLLMHTGQTPELDAEVALLNEPMADCARAFKLNILAAHNVAGIPFKMALNSRMQREWQATVVEELSNAAGSELSPADIQARLLSRITGDPARAQRVFIEALEILRRMLNVDESFAESAEDLLAQALVMLWSALEVLVSDVVRCTINLNPSAALKVVSTDRKKKYFNPNVSLETLAGYGFDLSEIMGEVLFENQRLDNLQRMQDLISVLYPRASEVHIALKSSDLHRIWQQRHVIVHRRRIIDHRYVRNTGASALVGERLKIISDDVRDAHKLVFTTGVKLLAATRG